MRLTLSARGTPSSGCPAYAAYAEDVVSTLPIQARGRAAVGAPDVHGLVERYGATLAELLELLERDGLQDVEVMPALREPAVGHDLSHSPVTFPLAGCRPHIRAVLGVDCRKCGVVLRCYHASANFLGPSTDSCC